MLVNKYMDYSLFYLYMKKGIILHKLWNLLEEPEEKMHILFHSLIQNIYVNTNMLGDGQTARQLDKVLFWCFFILVSLTSSVHRKEQIPSLTILQGHCKSELTYSKGMLSQKNVCYFKPKFHSVKTLVSSEPNSLWERFKR